MADEPIKENPALVKIDDSEKPVDVVIKEAAPEEKRFMESSAGKTVMAPNTTEEEETVTAGQRVINLMWETTQKRIALLVIQFTLSVNTFVIVVLICLSFFSNKEINTATVAIITGSIGAINLTCGIVIGFYFSRTNHSQIGGTGRKATEGPTSRR